ncbi:MAG: hypothetical protein HN791_13195 [Gammaproteobacteria bacterium]|jgi:hypothetical protein|nr:hypothetical protein [Gammaproteobacteria bacterium]
MNNKQAGWVTPFSMKEIDKQGIRDCVERWRGPSTPETIGNFISNIEDFIGKQIFIRSLPPTTSNDFNDIMEEISEASKILLQKLNRLNEYDVEILGQNWFVTSSEIINFPEIYNTVNKLHLAADWHESPPPKSGNPDTAKPQELSLSSSIASAWIFHFGKAPGQKDGGPFHRVLNIILPLAGLKEVGYDIVKKAIKSAKVSKGM